MSSWPFRRCICLAAALSAFLIFLMSSDGAYAVSDKVKTACQDDYFQHCSEHALGSASLRQCMRNVGAALSSPCILALVEEGEITKADIVRYQAGQTEGDKTSSGQNEHKAQRAPASSKVGDKSKGTNVDKAANSNKTAKAGNTAKANKAGNGSKATKVASVDKAANSNKTAKAGSTAKANKTGNGSKATKVASVDKAANRSKSDKATKSKTASEPGAVDASSVNEDGRSFSSIISYSETDP